MSGNDKKEIERREKIDKTKEEIGEIEDTTKYGVDIYGETKLSELLHKLSEIEGIKWIRFLYSYPEGITEDLITEVANNNKTKNNFN